MQTVSLNGTWRLTYGPQQPGHRHIAPPAGWPTITAQVPGNVELDLMAAGVLPDLSIGNNIYLLRDYETYEWWYTRDFTTPALADDERIELVFEGLDCLAEIWLNNQRVGQTDNMLIAHRFDVTDLVRGARLLDEQPIRLTVHITSAVLEGRRHTPAPLEYAFATSWEALNVRKAPHMYGWDIMPRLVSAGLWRDVRLDILAPTRFRAVYWATIETNPAQRSASLSLDWSITSDRANIDGLAVRVSIAREGQPAMCAKTLPVISAHGREIIALSDVDLWWPRGYGEPALYDATLELLDEHDTVLDTRRDTIGLRTIALSRSDITTDEEPGDFAFVVNGERIYCRGTNWVPLDALHARDKQHLAPAMDMIADLNCNMIRCWGGNVYEDHDFFDLCDRQGVLVWQDFALACAIYPQTDAFAERIRVEAEAVVEKLRNHPSLALWAGNNEIDEMYAWSPLPVDPNTDRLSREVLPAVVRRLDPYRPYLPSSPYRSPELYRRGNRMELQPEQHLWGPRDDFKGPFYTQSRAHFVSEIGYHGCPDRRSLEQFLDAGSLWPWQDNEQWLTHAARPHPNFTDWNYRIPLMAKQTAVLFGQVPDNLDDFVLASQITQAEAKKFFIEWWRQGKGWHTGMLWWNLRDGWPIISDAIVDYYGRKKLAYSHIQRAQTDVCAIVCEPREGRHDIVVVNDTRQPTEGRITVHDADSGATLFEGDYTVEANGKTVAGSLGASDKPAFWLVDYTVGKQRQRNHYLAGPRPFTLSDYRRWLRALEQ